LCLCIVLFLLFPDCVFSNLIFVYVLQWEINKHLSINWKYPKHVPECISFELKSCTIVYEGRENDIRFTKYILQNARILEVMKITINPHSSPKPNPQLLEELSLCPMISSQCKLSILGWVAILWKNYPLCILLLDVILLFYWIFLY
jgi:hypothetical protein